ncbi:MAG TPA: DUF892 family protein [Solirubrobacteraceae bacterium]|nr:DUF892 family protein [Solirubrobacteraceae bacterium]
MTGQHVGVRPGLEHDLTRWLVALHAVEEQALVHLSAARHLVGEPALAAEVARHREETREHRETLRALLAERGGRPSRLRDAAATVNRMGFLLYTALAPDAPGKLLVDSFTYEYFEIAAYRMLAQLAAHAGDAAVVRAAQGILAEEQRMAAQLADRFDWAVQASARRRGGPRAAHLVTHLQEARAIEAQAGALLALGTLVARPPALVAHLRAERRRTAAQRARLAARLRALGASPRGAGPLALRSAAMRVTGAAWAGAWALQRDTPARLACFLYAERALQIAAYELLGREAAFLEDVETAELATQLLGEERAATGRLAELLEAAAEASLRRTGV